jgi:hypothetical protein
MIRWASGWARAVSPTKRRSHGDERGVDFVTGKYTGRFGGNGAGACAGCEPATQKLRRCAGQLFFDRPNDRVQLLSPNEIAYDAYLLDADGISRGDRGLFVYVKP